MMIKVYYNRSYFNMGLILSNKLGYWWSDLKIIHGTSFGTGNVKLFEIEE